MTTTRYTQSRARVLTNGKPRIYLITTSDTADAGSSSITYAANNATVSIVQPLHSLSDDFGDGSIDLVKWPASYGGFAEAGGRAQIDCDVLQFSGLKSASAYYLDESCFLCQPFPATANTATISYFSLLVTTTTAGTDAGFNIDTASSGIGYLMRVGFSDPGAVFDTYDPVSHAWVRLRETSGQLFWETSPDGQTWTIQRTETSPSWVTDTTLAFVAESKRDAGTDNVSELDNFNYLTDTASAGVAAVSVTASNVSVTVSSPVSSASATVTAGNATPSVGATNGANPTAVFTANNATVTIGTSVDAGSASLAISVQSATTTVTPSAGSASVVVTSNSVTTGVSPDVSATSWTLTASNPSVSEAPHAGVSTLSLTASNATVSTSKAVDAGSGSVSLTAHGGTTQIASVVGVATLALDGLNPSALTGAVVPAGAATLSVSALEAVTSAAPVSQSASWSVTSHDSSSTVQTVVDIAALALMAHDATVSTTVTVTDIEAWGFTL